MKRILAIIGVLTVVLASGAMAADYGYFDGKTYERVGCYLSGPGQCWNSGGRYKVGEDIYLNGVMHWRYVGDLGSGIGADAGQPASSSSIAVNKVIRQNIFQQARPKAQPKQPAKQGAAPAETKPSAFYESIGHFGRLNSGAADVFYNSWEVEGYQSKAEGSTIGLNPSFTWGDADELTLTAPLHIVSPDGGDTIFAIGLDGAYKRQLTGQWENVAVGIHAYGMGFFGGDDTATVFGGGPFVAYNYRVNEKWILSAGGLLEITVPDEGDTITELVPGVNVGYNLSDNVALNGYLIHYKNLDSDVSDDAYTDVGVDVQWVKGGWSLSGGLKTTTGLDYVDSTEIHLGSNWMF